MTHGPSNKKRFLLLAALACAGSAFACTAPTPEPQGATSAKLLAPQAMFQVKATLATKQKLGIAEWRIFRGQHDFVLTGYDTKGKPVKGVSLGFLQSTAKSKAALRGRWLDGSFFAARHEYGGSSHANHSMNDASKIFAQAAISDMKTIGNHFHFGPFDPSKKGTTTPTTPAPTTPTTPTTPYPPIDPTTGLPMDPGAMDCGGDLMGAVMAALQCLMSSGAGAAGTADPNAVMMCVMAAQGASGAGGSCADQGTIQPPYDPTGMGGDPTGMGGDPYGTGAGGDPYGTGAGGDPYGTGAGGDPYGSMGDPGAGGMIDDMGGGCPSCPGGAGDIYGDPYSGDVGLGDPGAMGGDYGEGY